MLTSESCNALAEQDFMSKISDEIFIKFLFLSHMFRLKLEKVIFFYLSIVSDELNPGQDVQTNHFLDF